MIFKQTIFKIENMEIIDSAMSKVAGAGIPADETYDPDFLYLRVRAVSAGEYYGDNKNGDWFPEVELKKTYKTFLTGHVFKNHENKDPAAAIGEVLDSEWDDNMKCVCLVIKIDRKIAPSIVRAIEKGYMTDVSMGCRVPYSICSICGKKARNPKEYCDHIKLLRRKILPDGRKVFEINIQPKFHDISVVLSGAEKVAKITDIYDEKDSVKEKGVTPIEKVASFENDNMEKVASYQDMIDDAFELPHSDKIAQKIASEKTAAFEKKVRGAILGEARKNLLGSADTSRQILKCLFTPYWDDETLNKMNLKIKALAVQKKKPLPLVFHEFLKVLDFAGIELSPKEFTALSRGVFKDNLGFKSEACENPLKCLKNFERITDSTLNDSAYKSYDIGNVLSFANQITSTTPAKKIRIIIRASKPIDACNDIQPDIMRSIVAPYIPERSVHPEPLIKRIRVIKVKPLGDHFSSASPLINLLYSLYQNGRVNRLVNGETSLGMKKFASYFDEENDFEAAVLNSGFEKSAEYNKFKASIYGTPLIYGYSKLQQARMKNKAEQGEDNVGAINRMFAEYPEAIAGLNILFGPKVYREIKGTSKAIKNSAAVQKLKNIDFSKVKFKKTASVFDPATRMYSEGNEDSARDVLEKCGFTENDYFSYMAQKVAECEAEQQDSIEKTAREITEEKSSLSKLDDFELSMSVNEIIQKKLKNLC